MTYLESWEEFEQAAERLYLQDPMKCRFKICTELIIIIQAYFTGELICRSTFAPLVSRGRGGWNNVHPTLYWEH